MTRGLSYTDAVRLLGGGPRNRIVAALDRLTGGVLLVASATGAALPLSLFDAKAELFRLSDELGGRSPGSCVVPNGPAGPSASPQPTRCS